MAKQVHVRLDDAVYEALSEYNLETNSTVQDSIASAIMMFLKQQNKERKIGNADFKFIDLFAGIGGMRIAYEQAGGHCVYSNEWNKYSQQTYFANFGELPEGDITKVNEKIFQIMMFWWQDFHVSHFLLQVFQKQSMGRATGFEDKTQGTLFLMYAEY